MSLELPRLPLWVQALSDWSSFVSAFTRWYADFQIWWQKTVEAIENHELVQEGLISNLQTTTGELTIAQEQLEATQLAQANTTTVLTETIADVVAAQAAADTAQGTADTANASLANVNAAATYSATGIDLVSGAAYKINTIQVMGPRITGWGAPSGTLTRTTFAAYAGQTVSNPPTQAQVQAIDDHLKIVSERLAALVTDQITQGSIGA